MKEKSRVRRIFLGGQNSNYTGKYHSVWAFLLKVKREDHPIVDLISQVETQFLMRENPQVRLMDIVWDHVKSMGLTRNKTLKDFLKQEPESIASLKDTFIDVVSSRPPESGSSSQAETMQLRHVIGPGISLYADVKDGLNGLLHLLQVANEREQFIEKIVQVVALIKSSPLPDAVKTSMESTISKDLNASVDILVEAILQENQKGRGARRRRRPSVEEDDTEDPEDQAPQSKRRRTVQEKHVKQVLQAVHIKPTDLSLSLMKNALEHYTAFNQTVTLFSAFESSRHLDFWTVEVLCAEIMVQRDALEAQERQLQAQMRQEQQVQAQTAQINTGTQDAFMQNVVLQAFNYWTNMAVSSATELVRQTYLARQNWREALASGQQSLIQEAQQRLADLPPLTWAQQGLVAFYNTSPGRIMLLTAIPAVAAYYAPVIQRGISSRLTTTATWPARRIRAMFSRQSTSQDTADQQDMQMPFTRLEHLVNCKSLYEQLCTEAHMLVPPGQDPRAIYLGRYQSLKTAVAVLNTAPQVFGATLNSNAAVAQDTISALATAFETVPSLSFGLAMYYLILSSRCLTSPYAEWCNRNNYATFIAESVVGRVFEMLSPRRKKESAYGLWAMQAHIIAQGNVGPGPLDPLMEYLGSQEQYTLVFERVKMSFQASLEEFLANLKRLHNYEELPEEVQDGLKNLFDVPLDFS